MHPHVPDLPDAALAALGTAADRATRKALRATCRRTRAAVNAQTQEVRVSFGKGDAADVLGRITQSFPLMSALIISSADAEAQPAAADKQLADALAALPDGCWPALDRIEPAKGSIFALPPRAAAHLPRLCPRLRRACVSTWYSSRPALGAALCGALEGLEAANSTLEELLLYMACGCLRPSSIQRAAAALARLQNLRKLEVFWICEGPKEAASLLPKALPALSALTSLQVLCAAASPLPSLSGCPASLRDLMLRGRTASWALRTLKSAPQLAGVTRLYLQSLKDDCDEHGALAAAASCCPQLLELRLLGLNLANPAGAAAGATFAHLTSLELRNCEVPQGSPVPDLAVLMPRLKAMGCCGTRCWGCGPCASDHPSLRELRLYLQNMDEPGGCIEWYEALETLPKLSDLELFVGCSSFDEEDFERDCSKVSGIRTVAQALQGCTALTRLEFSAAVYPRLQDMLALIGAAAGARLERLLLDGAILGPLPAEEARAFWALPLYYPRLKRLEFKLYLGHGRGKPRTDEALTAMLRTLGVVLPHCPSLEEVLCEPQSGGNPQQYPRAIACCEVLASAVPGKRLKVDFALSDSDSDSDDDE